MKTRAVVSLALAAAVGLGLTACNYISPQRTTVEYAASDGVNATAGDFEIRNAMLIAPDGASGDASHVASLVMGVVNHSGRDGTLEIAAPGTSASASVALRAGEQLTQVGYGADGQRVELTGSEFRPGAAVELAFTPAGGSTQKIAVPVLDGTLPEYRTLVPTPTPSATALSSSAPGATSTEEPGATGTPTATP